MRIIDVIDHTNVMDDELVYRVPQGGSGDFRMGSQLIVSESQAAIFLRKGEALDAFGPGRHTLSVANLPILSSIIGMGTSGRTPFTADVYFVNLKEMPQVPWGTSKPIYLKVTTGLGVMLLRTHGVLQMRVNNPMLFLKNYGINKNIVRLKDIKDRIQTMLLGEINSLLLSSGVETIFEANEVLEQIEGAMLVKVNDQFESLGLTITAFEANPFDTVTVPIEELRDIVPLDVWLEVLERQKRLDIGMAAAQNPGAAGTLAGAGVGFGVGQSLGGQFGQPNQDVSNIQQQLQQQQMQMQQMMMMMMNNNQGGTPQMPQQQAAPTNPQTKEEIQALLDNLDLRFANGEISEAIYNRMVEKWQARLDSM